ncbi:MAG: hypothetical protein H6736_22825 [Alphaproteobacteria bacterium]|nr:hypothetical protein [Alphaproteobacteria bacterium]MCB9694655.1 hypothetical protein [Alphaproteobacteria bacterium]
MSVWRPGPLPAAFDDQVRELIARVRHTVPLPDGYLTVAPRQAAAWSGPEDLAWLALRGPAEELRASVVVLVDPEDGAAVADASSALGSDREDVLWMADFLPPARPTVEALVAAGLVVGSRTFVGPVDVALERVTSRVRTRFADHGLEVRTRKLRDVDAIVDLVAPSFARPFWVEGFRDGLIAGWRSPYPGTWVVSDSSGGVVGYLGMSIHGGVDVVLAKHLCGRGLGWAAYWHLLAELHAFGIPTIWGNTVNPAVVHMAREMGRAEVSTSVGRRGAGPYAL